jgi:hypothetical protein
MRLPHHLVRSSTGVFHFRQKVPIDLYGPLRLRVIKRSLGLAPCTPGVWYLRQRISSHRARKTGETEITRIFGTRDLLTAQACVEPCSGVPPKRVTVQAYYRLRRVLTVTQGRQQALKGPRAPSAAPTGIHLRAGWSWGFNHLPFDPRPYMSNDFNDSPIERTVDDRYGVAPFAGVIARAVAEIRDPIGPSIHREIGLDLAAVSTLAIIPSAASIWMRRLRG